MTQTAEKIELDLDEITTEAPEETTSAETAEQKPAGRVRSTARRVKSFWKKKDAEAQAAYPKRPVPLLVWAGLYRTLVLLVDYMLMWISVTGVIPMLGLWLFQNSGAGQSDFTANGAVLLWGMPLLFAVLVLAAGEIAVMRGLWRWATRRIEAVKARRASAEADGDAKDAAEAQTDAEAEAAPTEKTTTPAAAPRQGGTSTRSKRSKKKAKNRRRNR